MERLFINLYQQRNWHNTLYNPDVDDMQLQQMVGEKVVNHEDRVHEAEDVLLQQRFPKFLKYLGPSF